MTAICDDPRCRVTQIYQYRRRKRQILGSVSLYPIIGPIMETYDLQPYVWDFGTRATYFTLPGTSQGGRRVRGLLEQAHPFVIICEARF